MAGIGYWPGIDLSDYESFWSRDAANGFLFPKNLTDLVGINTNTPGFQLDVNGSINATFSDYTFNVSGNFPTSSSPGAGFTFNDGSIINYFEINDTSIGLFCGVPPTFDDITRITLGIGNLSIETRDSDYTNSISQTLNDFTLRTENKTTGTFTYMRLTDLEAQLFYENAGGLENILVANDNGVRITNAVTGANEIDSFFDISNGEIQLNAQNTSAGGNDTANLDLTLSQIRLGHFESGVDTLAFRMSSGGVPVIQFYNPNGGANDELMSFNDNGVMSLYAAGSADPNTVLGSGQVSLLSGGTSNLLLDNTGGIRCGAIGSVLFRIENTGQIHTNQADGTNTVGAQLDRFPIYDETGSLLGYVPIYAAS